MKRKSKYGCIYCNRSASCTMTTKHPFEKDVTIYRYLCGDCKFRKEGDMTYHIWTFFNYVITLKMQKLQNKINT